MFSTCLFTSGYKKRKSIRENGFYLDSQEHFIWKKKQKTEASTDFPSSSPRCVLLLLSKVFEQLSVYLFVFGVCMLWGFPAGDAVSWGAGYAKWQIWISMNVLLYHFECWRSSVTHPVLCVGVWCDMTVHSFPWWNMWHEEVSWLTVPCLCANTRKKTKHIKHWQSGKLPQVMSLVSASVRAEQYKVEREKNLGVWSWKGLSFSRHL